MKTVVKQRNFVAKYAREVNKSAIFRDRTKYSRKPKHKASYQ